MMEDFVVYFEVFGKKMKTTVTAKSRSHAEEIIKNKIVFHKIKKADPVTWKSLFDDLHALASKLNNFKFPKKKNV